MARLMELFLSFTQNPHSRAYKLLSLVPGTIIFLIITPLFLFFFSRYLSHFIAITCPRNIEIGIAAAALIIALFFMSWALLVLWFAGQGTPAPIAPTQKLVTIGPYKYCRNPIELGTDLYFLAIGTWFDSLATGLLCMFMGMLLGFGYIKIIEERELRLRFGQKYDEYLKATPLFLCNPFTQRGK